MKSEPGKAVIYKITYSNGKIYIGKDLTNTLTYFGSPDADYVAKDFSEDEKLHFTATKEILYSSFDANEISKLEPQFITRLQSNNPKIGYNKWPSWKGGCDA